MTFYRRNLPHWIPEGKAIFITWRLYGTLPTHIAGKSAKVRAADSSAGAIEESPGRRFVRLDAALDRAGFGPRWLGTPELAAYAEAPIIRGAEIGRYKLHAYVNMPNHVHILLDPYVPLSKISGVIKGLSACEINASLGCTGQPFWQDESFDHWIRSSAEFDRVRRYIEWNPVRAGLVARPEDLEMV